LSYEHANLSAAPRVKEINERLRDLSGKILAVQNVFTPIDEPTSTPPPTDIETEPATPPSNANKKISPIQGRKSPPSRTPTAAKQKYNFPQLEETYNELRNERTSLSAELGELIKPVNEQKESWTRTFPSTWST